MKTKNNHYVTQAFSENFRSNPGSPFFTLNCKTDSIQTKGLKTLFMKRHAWGDGLEHSFGVLENEVMPAIKTILRTPFASFKENVRVERLYDNGCSIISRYFKQILMLQVANGQSKDEHKDSVLAKYLESNSSEWGDFSAFIRYNPKKYEDRPFVLFDNVASYYVAPIPDEKQPSKTSSYKLCLVIPISEYSLLFFGDAAFLDLFLVRFRSPHNFNLYRIIQENRECTLASQNHVYIQFIAHEHHYYVAAKDTAHSYSVRSRM